MIWNKPSVITQPEISGKSPGPHYGTCDYRLKGEKCDLGIKHHRVNGGDLSLGITVTYPMHTTNPNAHKYHLAQTPSISYRSLFQRLQKCYAFEVTQSKHFKHLRSSGLGKGMSLFNTLHKGSLTENICISSKEQF